MDEQRLKAFEDMLAAILKQYDDTTGKDGEAQSRGQGENRHLPPAFRQQAATSGDAFLLSDVWAF